MSKITNPVDSVTRGARRALGGGLVCLAGFGMYAGFGQSHGTASPHLTLGRAFTDNAVLQRDRLCPVFGCDLPGTTVTVTFAGQTLRTTSGPDGRWRVDLRPLAPSALPQTLTVSGSVTLVRTNLLVGDVWLVSGQSNADFPLKSATGGAAAIGSATNTVLRYLQLAEAPRTDASAWSAVDVARLNASNYFSGAWQMDSPASAGAVSAVGYFFARELAAQVDVPIGLIDCAVGGTPAVSWMPEEALRASPRLRAMADDYLGSEMVPGFAKTRLLQNLADWDRAGRPAPMPEHPYKPGACWRLGLGTVAPFAIRGVLWYQGETDADLARAEDYDRMADWHVDTFRNLVAAWRKAWEQADLLVCFVQLPQMNRESWPWFRESQLRCAQVVSNTAMVVAYDCGEPDNVHPRDKKPVADRLVRVARALVYHQPIESSGPVLRSWKAEGSTMVLHFDHASGGLVSADSEPLRLFQIAGQDRRFWPATATILSNTAVLVAKGVSQPVAARYAWFPTGRINFFNRAGLPASPFRTDRWPAAERSTGDALQR